MNTEAPVGVVAVDTSKVAVYGPQGQYYGMKENAKMVMMFKDLPLNTPVYERPVELIGLSDAERLELFYKYVGESTMGYPLCDLDWINYAAAVEMKLREKNGL